MPLSLKVRHYMNPNFLTLKADQDIHGVIALFNTKRLFGAPVVDNVGNVIGILSGTDCIRAAVKYGFHPGFRGVVADFMTTDVVTVEAESSILQVADKFFESHYRRFPVLHDNRVIGQIGRVDVLQAIEKLYKKS